MNISWNDINSFYDGFGGAALDTVNRWLTAGTAPAVNNGVLTAPAAVSTNSSTRSRQLFPISASISSKINFVVALEATAATGAGRFWGIGLPAAAPSPTSLVADGLGWEVESATGNLLAVTYRAGARTVVSTIVRPASNAFSQYSIVYRQDIAQWFVNDESTPVASVAFPNLAVGELPLLIVRNNAAAYTGTPDLRILAVGVGGVAGIQDATLLPPPPAAPKPISTYTVTTTHLATGALVAGTSTAVLSIEHAATATKTVKIDKIVIGGAQSTALAGNDSIQVYRGTAASTAGAAVVPVPVSSGLPAAEATARTIPTIVVPATPLVSHFAASTTAAAGTGFNGVPVYDSETDAPLTLRPGVLETFVVSIVSSAAKNYTLSLTVIFTEQ